jgi:hypothetical protein
VYVKTEAELTELQASKGRQRRKKADTELALTTVQSGQGSLAGDIGRRRPQQPSVHKGGCLPHGECLHLRRHLLNYQVTTQIIPYLCLPQKSP